MRVVVSIAVLCGLASAGCLDVPLSVPPLDAGTAAPLDMRQLSDGRSSDDGVSERDVEKPRDGARDAGERSPYFVSVTTAGQFVCALTDDGRVACWGSNFRNAIDIEDDSRFLAPTWVAEEFRFKQLAAGVSFVCGVTTDSKSLVCWGTNDDQLLVDTDDAAIGAEEIDTSFTTNDLERVRVSQKNICVHLVDSTVWCWGSNQYWVVEPGGSSGSLEPMRMSHPDVYPAAAHACGKSDGGSVQCWGNNASFRAVPSGSQGLIYPASPDGSLFMDVAPATLHTCGLKQDGTIVCWGSTSAHRLGEPFEQIDDNKNVVPGVSQVERIEAENGTCALHTDGDITCWGPVAGNNNRPPTRFEATDSSAFESVAVGTFGVCATSASGVWCWGSNSAGTLGRFEAGEPVDLTSEVPLRIEIAPPP